MDVRKYVPAVLDNLIWVLLIGVIILFSTQNSAYLSPLNFLNILFSAAVLGLMVIGETFVLITGNIDLSVESTVALCALLGAWLTVRLGPPDNGLGIQMNPFLAIAALLAAGAFVGWFNGFLITRMKMNDWVVTLAMLIALRGLMHLLPAGNTVYNTTMPYNFLGQSRIGPIPLPVIVIIVAFAAAFIVLKYTPFGRSLYAIGGNRMAARASGINPERRIRQVYLISGILSAVAGWMLGARITAVPPNLASGYVFDVMAASVIGGISLQGGRGSMLGSFGGVLLLAAISSGLNLTDVNAFWIDPIRGGVILLAMLIDAQKVRYRAPVVKSAPTPASASPGAPPTSG
ncbi:MAG: ABC transporter permease [Anaerolineales bacterium]|jgi:ribose/xylose/arabinose/galactoside ABC-type transport system permease subunit